MDPEIKVEVVNPPVEDTQDSTTKAVEAIAAAAALTQVPTEEVLKVERTIADLWDYLEHRLGELFGEIKDTKEACARIEALQIVNLNEDEEVKEEIEDAAETIVDNQAVVVEQIQEATEKVEEVPEKVEEQKKRRRWL